MDKSTNLILQAHGILRIRCSADYLKMLSRLPGLLNIRKELWQ